MTTPTPAAPIPVSKNGKILLLVLLIVAAAVAVYFLFFSKPKPKETTTATNDGTEPPVVTPRFTPEEKAALVQRGKDITETLGTGGKVVAVGNQKIYMKPDGTQSTLNKDEALSMMVFTKNQKMLGKR